MTAACHPLTMATYNIHKCVGRDGAFRPDRIFAVIEALDADIVGIQEFDSRPHPRRGNIGVADFEANTGYDVIAQPTMQAGGGFHGNLLLSRLPLIECRLVDISVRGFEPRGAIIADVAWGDGVARLATTHLGLWPGARRGQARRLLAELQSEDDTPVVVAGDFNEWLPISGCLGVLGRELACPPSAATFPAHKPRVRFDRVWVAPAIATARAQVYDGPPAAVASDHLPVKVTLAR